MATVYGGRRKIDGLYNRLVGSNLLLISEIRETRVCPLAKMSWNRAVERHSCSKIAKRHKKYRGTNICLSIRLMQE